MRSAQSPLLHRGASLALRAHCTFAIPLCRFSSANPGRRVLQLTPNPFKSTRRPSQQSRTATQAAAPTGKASLIRQVQRDLATKQRSAVEVTQHYIDRLHAHEPRLHSFVTVSAEEALAQAAAVDRAIAAGYGGSLGPLAGVPIAVKDTICTLGLQTTAGSKVLEGYRPPFDATCVRKLRAAGAAIVGKANCDQFAMGSTSETSAYQETRNPWDTDRVPGGSSGGSASSIAGGQCIASLGSDTGGSIRQPAHFCGVVGIKPTYGRVSRYGLIAYGSSFDCVGPLAPTVEDAAIVLTAISGLDPHDATSAQQPVPDFAAGLQPAAQLSSCPLAGKRIAVIEETMGEGVQPGVQAAVQAAVEHLEALGASISQVSLPTFDMGLPAYYVLAFSEASSNLSRYDGIRYGLYHRAEGQDLRGSYNATREAGLGAEVKRRILMGTYALSAGYNDAYYQKAQKVRTLVQREMYSALEQYDALVSPVAPSVAWRVGEVANDPLAQYKGDIMTVNLNLAGLPAVAVPCGFDSTQGGGKLPVGLQLIGPAFGEAGIIEIAHIFEQTADFAFGSPPDC